MPTEVPPEANAPAGTPPTGVVAAETGVATRRKTAGGTTTCAIVPMIVTPVIPLTEAVIWDRLACD